MEPNKVLNRDGEYVNEQTSERTFEYRGVEVTYNEVFYEDHGVDESTGMIITSRIDKFYTKKQVERNRQTMLIAYGAASIK